jgi:hypothetical protein
VSFGVGDFLRLGALASFGAFVGLLTTPVLGPLSLLASLLFAVGMLLGPGHLLYKKRFPVSSPPCPSCGSRVGFADEVPGDPVSVMRCLSCEALVEVRLADSNQDPRPDMAVLQRAFPSWSGRFEVAQPPAEDKLTPLPPSQGAGEPLS